MQKLRQNTDKREKSQKKRLKSIEDIITVQSEHKALLKWNVHRLR